MQHTVASSRILVECSYSSPCEVFMEDDKPWITYVIIANSGAGWLEIRTAQRQGKGCCKKLQKSVIFISENCFTNLLLPVPRSYITTVPIGVESFSLYPQLNLILKTPFFL